MKKSILAAIIAVMVIGAFILYQFKQTKSLQQGFLLKENGKLIQFTKMIS